MISKDHTRRVRVYEAVRTAHLERFHALERASVLFSARNYDFDEGLATGLDIQQFHGVADLARKLWKRDVDVLEINEPLMLSATKFSLAAVLTVRVRALTRRRRVTVVSYAIGNQDPFVSASPRTRSRWRRWSFRLATRLLVSQVDRLAVGTPGAMVEYGPYLRNYGGEAKLVPALPTQCEVCGPPIERDRSGVVFVGAFDGRKGLRHLLEAWTFVREGAPGATLCIMGKGDLQGLAEDAARRYDEVTLEIDPARQRIHEVMRASKVLVLLSQPSATWREQVGLPIVEGLSHGCEIVATTETGVAAWLSDHGHQVVDAARSGPDEVASAVMALLASDRSGADVVRDLPPVDGRLAANQWMFGMAENDPVRRS